MIKQKDPETELILKSYAAGVNDYVQGIRDQKMAKLQNWGLKFELLPLEFLFFGITIEDYEPWTPVDSILITRLNSFQ